MALMPPPHLLIINGPNLNLLGLREAAIYGTTTLAGIREACYAKAELLGLTIDFYQSNHEGELVEKVQQAMGNCNLIIINPAAYTHTSVAIRDALLAVALPVIEVHLSNIHKREPFRHHSYISDIALGVIAGFGGNGYLAAMDLAKSHLEAQHAFTNP